MTDRCYTNEEIAAAQRPISEKYGIGKGKLTPIEEPRAPVRVKKLVWEGHPKGFMASTVGLGPAYIFQLSGSRYECIKGLYGSPRFDTSDEAKAAAQRDFNARILECLE